MSRPFLVSKGQPVQPVEHISRDPDFAEEFAEATRWTFTPVEPEQHKSSAGWWWLMVAVLSVIVLVAVGLKN